VRRLLAFLVALAFFSAFSVEADNSRIKVWHAPQGAAAPSHASFVGDKLFGAASGAQTLNYTSCGCSAGQILIVFYVNNSGLAGASLASSGAMANIGSNTDSNASTYAVYWAVLAAGDISGGTVAVTVNSAMVNTEPVLMSIWSGATTVTQKSWQTGGSTSLAFGGFAPSGSTKGVVGMVMNAGGVSGTASLTNGTWTFIENSTPSPSPSSSYFQNYLFDQLSGYTNATTTMSGLGAGGQQNGGYFLEFT
jgi:hypothetical protein